MMKPVKRVFLILGAMSMFSLFQFDAMAKCSDITAGQFCKNNSKNNCRKGCYCTGKTIDVKGINVDRACESEYQQNGTLSGSFDWDTLNSAGIYRCPKNFKHSAIKSDEAKDCYGKCAGNVWVYNKKVSCAAGKYLNPKKDADDSDACATCSKNYYCPGGSWFPSCTEDQGKQSCPDGYSFSDSGAKKITECKNASGEYYQEPVDMSGLRPSGTPRVCSDGYYLEETGSGKYIAVECKICPKGYYCPDKKNKHACTGNTYTSQEGQKVCQVCDGTVTKTGGLNTGCREHCADGQYLFYGIAIPGDVEAEAKRNTNMNEIEVAQVRSIVPRASVQSAGTSVSSLSLQDAGQGTTKALRSGMAGTCKDCEKGYYCPDRKNRYRCSDGEYTNTTGQQVCQVCYGTVTTTNGLNTGCSVDGVTTYSVTYDCGDGSGTSPSYPNGFPAGDSVVVLANTCVAPSGKTFDKWNCNNGIGNKMPGLTFTMPAANVTCTAQWDCDTANGYVLSNNGACVQNSEYSCDEREYLNYDGQCVTCTEGYYCPGDDQRHLCNGQQYAQAGASSCAQCTNGTVDDNHTTCTPNNPNNSIECASGTYYPGSGNVCSVCEAGYACPGGTFTKNNELVQGRGKCMPEKVSNSDRSACAVCPDDSSPNNDYTGCVSDITGGSVDPVVDPDSPTIVTTCLTPGKYLDNDGNCVSCTGGYFCRGDDARRNCPTGGASTTNGQSCKFSLDEGDLAYGLGTTNRNCWKYLNKPVQYRTCVYGINIDSLQ